MKKTWPFAFNFLYFAGFASLIPFLILYYQELGFGGLQISLLAGAAPLITFFCSPLWTNLADRTQRHKFIMSFCLVSIIGILILFPFLKSFAFVALAIALFNIFISPITSFADSATMVMLADEKAFYGRIRLGGTLGWGFAAPIAGYLIEHYGLKMAFWGCAVMLFLGFIVIQQFHFEKRHSEIRSKGSIRELLTNRRWIFFLAIAFFGGIAFTSTVNYYSPYMKELGASESLIGIALLVSTATEIPIFFFGNHLIRKYSSYRLLIFALAMTAVRSFLFAISTTPLFGLLSQLLSGFSFPVLWLAGVTYADENAPEGLKATAQGLFGALTFGFGSAVGGFLSGALLESIGGRGVFLVIGIILTVGLVLIEVARRILPDSGIPQPE